MHVADVGLLNAGDVTITEFASAGRRIVNTSDSDFGTILARLTACAVVGADRQRSVRDPVIGGARLGGEMPARPIC